jgi:hypothetical protein
MCIDENSTVLVFAKLKVKFENYWQTDCRLF